MNIGLLWVLCVLSGRGLCDELITRPEEPYRLWCVVVCDLETSRMRRPWPALGRSTKGKKKNISIKTAFKTVCLRKKACDSTYVEDVKTWKKNWMNVSILKLCISLVYVAKLNYIVWYFVFTSYNKVTLTLTPRAQIISDQFKYILCVQYISCTPHIITSSVSCITSGWKNWSIYRNLRWRHNVTTHCVTFIFPVTKNTTMLAGHMNNL